MPTLIPAAIKQRPPQFQEETSLNEVKSNPVNQKCKFIQDVAFASLFGLTTGLILGCSFGSHSEWKGRWMVLVIPLAFVKNPFRIYPGTSKSKQIARTAALSLSCIAGVAINLKPQHIVGWLDQNTKLTININTIIYIVQLVWAGINIYSANRLRYFEPAASQIKISDFIENVLLEEISTPSIEREGTAMNAFSFISIIFGLDHVQQPEINPEKLRQQIKEDTVFLREKNKRSFVIFDQLLTFVREDAELKEAFNRALSDSAGKLLPPYEEPQHTFKDRDIELHSRESQKALYWEGQVRRVEEFLFLNDEFSELLGAKFLASDIANKEELLRYFGFYNKKMGASL